MQDFSGFYICPKSIATCQVNDIKARSTSCHEPIQRILLSVKLLK